MHSLQEAKAAGAKIVSVGGCAEVAVVTCVFESFVLAHISVPVILVGFVLVDGLVVTLLNM